MNMFGSLLIAIVLSSFVYGITLLQTFHYFTMHSSRDRAGLKILVLTIMSFDSLHYAIFIHTVYYYLILGYDLAGTVPLASWSFQAAIITASPHLLLAQVFFALRIYRFSQGHWQAPLLIILLMCGQLASSIAWTVLAADAKTLDDFAGPANLPGKLGLWFYMFGNICITAAMVFYLHRSRSGFRNSDRALGRLIMYSMHSGLLVSITSALTLATSSGFVFLIPYHLECRLSANFFLSTLNSREGLRKILVGVDANVLNLTDTGRNGTRTGKMSRHPMTTPGLHTISEA